MSANIPDTFDFPNENMSPKITRAAFCGLRRINPICTNATPTSEFLHYWIKHAEWYNFKSINIFTGCNGAGKSTILELIDLIREPLRICTLARENRINHSHSAFMIDFDNQKRLRATIGTTENDNLQNASNLSSGIDIQSVKAWALKLDNRHNEEQVLERFMLNISKLELDADSTSLLVRLHREFDVEISFWTRDQELSPDDVVCVLNKASKYLTGLTSTSTDERAYSTDESYILRTQNPFHLFDDRRVGVWLGDDFEQFNHVHIEALPSGWMQLVSVLSWLEKGVNEGSICLIEEPETHLHPRLQRYLVQRMSEIVLKRKLQLFLTTHSPVFQNFAAWTAIAGDEVQMFEATGDKLETKVNASRLLDALGLRGSEISQSNGVIWVEGPSDRIYLKHWLSNWCKKNEVTVPKENLDYSFSFYGGAILSHFSVDETTELVDMLRINRNFAIVIDRDDDFEYSENGTLACRNAKSAKAKVLTEIRKANVLHWVEWVTHGYTIENYLPSKFRAKYFIEEGEHLVLGAHSKSKVQIAREYVSEFSSLHIDEDYRVVTDALLSKLYHAIQHWNK